MWQSLDSSSFHYFNFETSFLKSESFFKKLEYRFLFESPMMENAIFPNKTALSKANVKTNSIESTKYTYHNEWGFATKDLILWKYTSV